MGAAVTLDAPDGLTRPQGADLDDVLEVVGQVHDGEAGGAGVAAPHVGPVRVPGGATVAADPVLVAGDGGRVVPGDGHSPVPDGGLEVGRRRQAV